MESFIELIEKKIKDKIEVETIKIIDNSFKHKKHKSFEKNKLHLEMIIYSRYLRSLNKIQAHKEVMKILKDELKEKIHALELKIK
mgnify:CR=1 FL=1|tara:strand:- start:8317 stop:8571 length:255 start_codon:yes stop_codon:yes gene_type:complete